MLLGQNTSDTIFALSTGQLPSGIAVVRVSGNRAFQIVRALCGSLPQARQAKLVQLKDEDGLLIDHGLCLIFPAPHSFTGEDCAEFQVHGGKAVVNKLLEVLGRQPHCRMAEAGEFAKRAFLNGKLNLTEAEALADLIDAETEAQRQFALSNHTAAHEALYESWRKKLLHIRAFMEAELDFADESDVPEDAASWIWGDLQALQHEVQQHIDGYRVAEIIREGFRIALIGAPNAGKSTLLNHLAKREAAIVSSIPGTTRDVIEVSLDLRGYKVILSDTAGIREEADEIEVIGIERSVYAAENAQLILHLMDSRDPVPVLAEEDERVLSIGTKTDLAPAPENCRLGISVHTNVGIEQLIELMTTRCEALAKYTAAVSPFRERHVKELRHGELAITRSLELGHQGHLELAAEEMREASNALARICGKADVEELLGVIFSSFCVGK